MFWAIGDFADVGIVETVCWVDVVVVGVTKAVATVTATAISSLARAAAITVLVAVVVVAVAVIGDDGNETVRCACDSTVLLTGSEASGSLFALSTVCGGATAAVAVAAVAVTVVGVTGSGDVRFDDGEATLVDGGFVDDA